jgi:hypothetical protein
MHPVSGWTGRTACALQAALRLSNEAFAQHLGIGVRAVATWHQKPSLRPKSEMQRILDTALDRAPAAARDRFAVLAADPADGPATARTYQPEHAAGQASPSAIDLAEPAALAPSTASRLETDPAIGAALHWLDRHAGWPSGRSRAEVASRLARFDPSQMRSQRGHRERAARHDIAATLATYYSDRTGNHGRYAARYGPDTELTTSVLTSPDWLDLDCLLHNGGDHLTVSTVDTPAWQPLDDKAAGYAAQRLAETLARRVRIVDMPLYRLFGIEPRRGSLTGRLGLSHFIRYALTLDLPRRRTARCASHRRPRGAGLAPSAGQVPAGRGVRPGCRRPALRWRCALVVRYRPPGRQAQPRTRLPSPGAGTFRGGRQRRAPARRDTEGLPPAADGSGRRCAH